MNSTNSTTPMNQLYLEYKSNGIFKMLLFVMSLMFAIIGAIGIILNASLCYISTKYRYHHPVLRSKTGILIVMNCFFEILHQSSHIIYIGRVFVNGTDFIPFQSALFIQAHTLIGITGVVLMLLCLSADRLLAILAPIFYIIFIFLKKYSLYSYLNVKTRTYIIGHLLFICIFSSYYFYVMIIVGIHYPDWMVTGAMGDFFSVPDIGMMSIYLLNVAIICIAICSYIFVGIIIKYKIDANNAHMRKLFRSIFLIVFINIGGYFLCNLVVALVLLSIFTPSPFQFWFLNNLTAIGLNIAAASNAPILYFNSSEYHEAYSKEMKRIKFAFFKLIGKIKINPQNSTMIEVTIKTKQQSRNNIQPSRISC